MVLLISCKMHNATLLAKLVPLSMSENVSAIFVLRKEVGPQIEKVIYLLLPKIAKYKLANVIITPILLLIYANKYRPAYLIGYHFLPHGIFVYLTSIFTKIPFIIGQTGSFIQSYSKLPLFGKGIKHIIRKSFSYNVPGKASKLFWEQNGIPNDKILILHSTINTNYFKPEQLLIKKKRIDFLILSRLSKEKRIDIIINALKHIRNMGYSYNAVIVGEGPEKNKLMNLVSSYKLNKIVEFVGFHENTLKWFQKSKYFLMYSESEGLPTALMQAMSCGLVGIVTNVGNTSHLVKNNINGFIFNFEDFDSYTDQLVKALEMDEKEYLVISSKARQTVIENHSYEVAVKNWKNLLCK